MKIFLALAVGVLVTGTASAVTVISDPCIATVTHCGRYEGGVFKADFPVVAGACNFNISAQPVGTTVYTATCVINDPVWGRRESVQSLPLSVPNPAVPTAPINLHVVP